MDKDGIDLKNYVDRPRRITPCYVTLRIIRKPNPSIDPFTATAASHSGGGQNTDPQSMDWTTHMDYPKMDYAAEVW